MIAPLRIRWLPMGRFLRISGLVRSRSGGVLLVFLALSRLISAGVAGYFYNSSLRTFVSQKAGENAAALELVDAFVTTYTRYRADLGARAPVPATFRAHSIATLNAKLGAESPFTLRWVGRQGREIKTPPVDAAMARTIEQFATAAAGDARPASGLLDAGGQRVLRTIYPSFAGEQGCVNCHNEMQPNGPRWQLGDLMGAFVIDIPAGPFLRGLLHESYALAACLFLALAGIGLALSILHCRQLGERERAAARLSTQNIRFNAALNNMGQGLCMFDGQRRLVICNERYARMYSLPDELTKPGTAHEDIIRHRVAHGILAGDNSESAVSGKLAELARHASDRTSTRIDTLADGRRIRVTRDPMPDGGWV